MELFHDRRPKPATPVRLTDKQRELAERYGIGVPDEKGFLNLSPEHHRAAAEKAHEMLFLSQEWSPEQRGDLRSAKNLVDKVVGAVRGARPESCPTCKGDGCGRCAGTGRRL